jgi:hypothetical protein
VKIKPPAGNQIAAIQQYTFFAVIFNNITVVKEARSCVSEWNFFVACTFFLLQGTYFSHGRKVPQVMSCISIPSLQ